MSGVKSRDKAKEDVKNRLTKLQNNGYKAGKNVSEDRRSIDVIDIDTNMLYPAPNSWNFFTPLSDEKMGNLIESIHTTKLQSPIVVLNVDRDVFADQYSDEELLVPVNTTENFMICAGHNRLIAYRKLYQMTNDSKYLRIPAIIYQSTGSPLADIKLAKDIIVDTNFSVRELNNKEKKRAIDYKWMSYQHKLGENINERIAEELGISRSVVYGYIALSKMTECIQELWMEDKVTQSNLLKLSHLNNEDQVLFCKEVANNLSKKELTKLFKNVKSGMSIDDILNIYKNRDDNKPETKITYTIPLHLKDEFENMVKEWLKNNN